MAKRKNDGATTGQIDLDVLGTTGLNQYGGMIDEEWLRLLKGPRAAKKYREMSDNSSSVGALLFAIESLVRQVEWRIEPADESQEAVDAAAFAESCLYDMEHTFDDFVSEVLSFLPFGWALFERCFKIRRGAGGDDPTTQSKHDDGRIGWRKFSIRAQDSLDRWEFDADDGTLTGMWQLDLTTGKRVLIPMDKAILFRAKRAKENPEGRSILRNAVISYERARRIEDIESIGIERDLAGLPTMEVPIEILATNASAAEKALRDALEKMLAQIKNDERAYALIPSETTRDGKPSGYKFKLLSTGGGRSFDTNAIVARHETAILRSTCAQFLMLGSGPTGSFALASSQTDLFATALGTFLGTISDTFNRFALDKLMALNGFASEVWPALTHGDIESPALAEIGQYITALATCGQLPTGDAALQRRLLEIASLPMPEEKDETAPPPASAVPPAEPTTKARRRSTAKSRGRVPRAPLRGLSIVPTKGS